MKTYLCADFSLEHTLDCGQFFLYEKIDDFYYIVHKDIVFKIKQEKDTLHYDYINEKELIQFFNLDFNLQSALKTKAQNQDKHLLSAIEKYYGLRIINQDLFQCIISFVCSSASNIPKIKNNLKLISKYFGEKIIIDGHTFYTFPKENQINDIEKLTLSKTGYRAKYIYQINQILKQNPNLLQEIKQADYKQAKKLLMQLPGIGSKVADCICLFSLNHQEAFPIDTWIKQILEQLYLDNQTKTIKQLEQFIENYFVEYGGLKQQYLFHYARNNLKNLK